MAQQKVAGDGVVTGWGTINGRQVYVFGRTSRFWAARFRKPMRKKSAKIMDMAVNTARRSSASTIPAARIQEGVASLAGYADVFKRNVDASGVVRRFPSSWGHAPAVPSIPRP